MEDRQSGPAEQIGHKLRPSLLAVEGLDPPLPALPPIDSDAIFVEELLEIARKLGRMHLVTIIKGDP